MQTLLFAMNRVMSSRFQVTETIEEARFKTVERYITIIEKSIALMQTQD